jgi:hypothetical protein
VLATVAADQTSRFEMRRNSMAVEIVIPVSALMFARNGNTTVVEAADGTEVGIDAEDGQRRQLGDGITRAVLSNLDFHLIASMAEGSDVTADNGVTYRVRVQS